MEYTGRLSCSDAILSLISNSCPLMVLYKVYPVLSHVGSKEILLAHDSRYHIKRPCECTYSFGCEAVGADDGNVGVNEETS